MRVRTLIIVLASGALVAAACGGSSGSAKSSSTTKHASTTTAAAPSSSPSSTPSALVDAQRRAQASLLAASDFAPGWTSTAHVDTPDTPAEKAASQQVANCLGIPDRDISGDNDVYGPDFALGQKFQVTDSASVIKSDAEATQVLNAINGPKFIPCFQPFVSNEIKTNLAKSAPTANVGTVTVKRLALPTHGDATAAIDVQVPVSGPRGQTTFFLDLVLVRSGLVGMEQTYFAVGQPFDPALRNHLLSDATDRLTGKKPPVAASSV